ERNFALLGRWPLPRFLKYPVVAAAGLVWKFAYYGPNIIIQTSPERSRSAKTFDFFSRHLWDPRDPLARKVWRVSWLAYPLIRFGAMPLPFLALGERAWAAVVVNSLVAELLANLYSFAIIVTNHAGGDVARFDAPAADEAEHALRQIVGSVNFPTGGD